MTDEGFKRKLTAILSADVEGYSRLMDDDEEATIRTLTDYREAMRNLIQQHRGRVVDTTGDNLLAEFTSAVDAVNCSVEIQRELAERNTELPYERRMMFRIGVNVGDVVEEEGRIYGDGVNIAARVEGLAEAGGICISGRVYDQVENKLDLEYEYLGEQEVKNIARPIRVYRVLSYPGAAAHRVVKAKDAVRKKWRKIALAIASVLIVAIAIATIWNFYLRPSTVEVASVKKMAHPLPDKPSIVVLPFDNLSKDPDQDYLVDGITDQIIAGLSKIPYMFVIAKESSFSYKGKAVEVRKVSEDLGVQYVLEGSVQRSGNRIRITVQLIDALSGRHMWSERYDRELKDIFELQDDIMVNIMQAMQLKIAGLGILENKPTPSSVEAYFKILKALELVYRFTKADNAQGRKLYEEAIELDPEYASTYRLLGWTYLRDVNFGWSEDPGKSLEKAEELANKAFSLGDDGVYHLLASLYLKKGQPLKAIAIGEKGLAINPNWANYLAVFAPILSSVGRYEEAIVLIKKAIRLNPHHPPWYLWFAGEVFWDAKRYDEAVPVFKKYIELTNAIWGYLFLIDVYIHLNREKEAQQIANEVVKKYPDFSIEKYVDPVVFDKQEDKRIIINSLQKVGLPEHRPLKLPDKPSIAVLPFDNLSDDPEQEYFSDGMTDDLITDLSKISGLFVIARNSAFQYKGKAVDVKRISQELGIRYVLEGSVRRAKDRVRINAQLIDATTGGHLWAERYDGQMDDIFSLQDKITQKIVAALAVRLTAGEQKSLTSKGTENIEAYDAFLKGWQHYIRFTPADFTAAITSFKKAIELDPNYGRAYAAMALMYFSGARVSKEMNKALGADFVEARLKARHYLNTAMKKPTDLAYKVSSLMDLKLRRHDEALHNIEKAIAINPNDADTQLTLAEVLIFIGRPKEAIDVIKKVMQLDPTRMDYCLLRLGLAHFCLEQYDEVVDSLERALRYNPTLKSDLDPLFATTYAHLGREAEAEAALEEYMKWWSENAELKNLEIGIPDLRHYVWDFPFKDPKITKRFVDGLIKAGWHEPHRYWEVYKENKLTGDEIRDLVFGRKCVGVSRGDIWTAKYDNEGNVFFEGYGLTDTGKAWIEGDQFCEKWKKFKGGLSGCADVYRNPTGTPEGKDEYFTAWDWNAISYSFVD